MFARFILGLANIAGVGELHLTSIRNFTAKYCTPISYDLEDDAMLRRMKRKTTQEQTHQVLNDKAVADLRSEIVRNLRVFRLAR